MTMGWKLPEFDNHLFEEGKSKRFAVITYTPNEMYKMIQFLGDFATSHPISVPASNILNATYYFIHATTQEKYFADMRSQTKKPDELKQILDNMATSFVEAKQFLDTLDKHSEEYHFLLSAIQYCKRIVNLQIEELKNNKDEIYEMYWQGSRLQHFIDAK